MRAVVPDAYLGVWRRSLLRTAAGDDTTSIVYWLQTPRWHADIRVPQARDPLPQAKSLADVGREGLRSLATQQGFAGVTTVEGDVCRWHRRVDFQPPSGFGDVGRIAFESPDRMLEFGVEQDYFEIWERVPGSVGPWAALENAEAAAPVWLFRSGAFAMRIRPREETLPDAENLAALVERGDTASARRRLDFEISLASSTGNGEWRVQHSTLPWYEGSALAQSPLLAALGDTSARTPDRHWRPLG